MGVVAFIRETRMRPVVKGLLTRVPGTQNLLPARGTGGTNTARYCYGVWLKHLTHLWQNGMRTIPRTMAELGPGDSLGIGLAAVLCGVDRYYALDVVEYSNTETNLAVLDELVALFRGRAPNLDKGWPEFDPFLDENLFPSHILSDESLDASLSEDRVAAIRRALKGEKREEDPITIEYMAPWSDASVAEAESVEIILSQSVLEHVVDLESTYRALYSWLAPGGTMTHQIDFKSHGISESWNGYRAIPEFCWKLITGNRPYLINRQPHSVHTDLIVKAGFEMICDMANHDSGGLQRSELSGAWKGISDTDLTCKGAFVQARK